MPPLSQRPIAAVRDKRGNESLRNSKEHPIHITRERSNLHGLRFNCRPDVSLLEQS